MPAAPEAAANPHTSSARMAGSWSASGPADRPNATVKSASPARIAVHSSKRLVHGRLAMAHIVVVHGGQVVVRQRITVYALDGGRGGERGAGRHREQARRFQDQKGPQALAPPRLAWRMAWIRRGGVPLVARLSNSRSRRSSISRAAFSSCWLNTMLSPYLSGVTLPIGDMLLHAFFLPSGASSKWRLSAEGTEP